jgi:pullulanase
MTSWDQINSNVKTDDTLRYGVVVNRINAKVNGDGWQDIIVIYNSADNYDYTLPDGTWPVAMEKSDPAAGKDRPVNGKVTAEGTAVTVLHR